MPFDPVYVTEVLRQNFDDARDTFLSALMAIHHAHLVMLAECGIVTRAEARVLRDALNALPLENIRKASFDGTDEDLFFYVERLLIGVCGEEAAGRLHTARSRNDIDMTMYRMRHREWIASLVEATLDLRARLIALASRHGETVFAAVTHTQPAQPTTIAHYLLAVIEQAERDTQRLRAAYVSTNRSPLGACAITGTGFPIDRRLTSDLLGFDGPTGNTYGSIASVDYLLESVAAAGVLLVGLGRVVQDLLLWCTSEVGYLRLGDGFVQCSSIMPQKRNPVALEHARALASKAFGQASVIPTVVHNTPFGDIVDTEDDLQPLVASMFRDARRSVTLVAAAMASAEFDVKRLASHAAEGGTTLTELADVLVREHAIPFKAAHRIASGLLTLGRGDPDVPLSTALARVSRDVLGHAIEHDDARIARMLSAQNFVAVRRTFGGPAPEETARALDVSRETLSRDVEWLAGVRDAVAAADGRRHERSQAL